MAERFTRSIQESVLCLLCFNDEVGHAAASILERDYFDEAYQELASKAIDFQRRHGKAPGTAHIDDIFDWVLSDPNHRRHKTYQGILTNLVQLSDGLNAEYIFSRITDFARKQALKSAIQEAASRIQEGGDGIVEDVELILDKAMRMRIETFNPGVFFNDPVGALSFLDHEGDVFYLGIPEFDAVKLGPARKKLLYWIAPSGRGKTWALIHTGVQTMLQRGKVLHITLEMPDHEVLERYTQMVFAAAKTEEAFDQICLQFDELGRFAGFDQKRRKPKYAFNDPEVRLKLMKRFTNYGARFGNLLVKEFPSGYLTVNKFIGFLDSLELIHNFVPDVILIDYPELMALDIRNSDVRVAIGETVKRLRGIGGERNMAIVGASQGNRSSMSAEQVTEEHFSEDISKFFTADDVITYSQTKAEQALGLARLFAAKHRGNRSGQLVLITQSYNTGQFCLQSTVMRDSYWQILERAVDGGIPERQL